MPEQEVGQVAPEWTPESVEKQAQELETQSAASQPEAKEEIKEEIQQKPKDTPEVELSKTKAALAETRAQKRAEAAKAREYERQLAEMRQQLQALHQPQQQQPPDLAQSPAERLLWEQEQIKRQLAFTTEQTLRQQQEAFQRQQVQSFVADVQRQNDEYVKEQPDANDGINFLKAARVDEYKAMGMSQSEAQARMLHDEVQLVQWAMQNGENPAKVAFEMARARGYVSQKQKLEMQRQGQGASLPSNSGGRAGGKVSLEALAKMSPEEFAKATSGANWEKLMRNA